METELKLINRKVVQLLLDIKSEKTKSTDLIRGEGALSYCHLSKLIKNFEANGLLTKKHLLNKREKTLILTEKGIKIQSLFKSLLKYF
jgi:predicted transcriptional regulator